MPDVGPDTAQIAASWAEAVLFGIFLVLFATSVYILGPLSRRTTGRMNCQLFATSVALFLLIGTHAAVSLRRDMEAFVVNEPVPGAVTYLNDTTQWTKPAMDLLYSLATLLGDGILIYRCFVVWSRRWWIIVPSVLLWCGTLVSAALAITMEFQLRGGEGIFNSEIHQRIEAFFSCTMATNGLTTCLIAFRIWRPKVDVRKFGQSNLGPVLAIILESGVLYSVTVFILIILYALKLNSQYVVLTMTTPIIGIVFSLIIVRVGLNRTMKTTSAAAPHSSGLRARGMNSGEQHELTTVTIERTVESFADGEEEGTSDSRSFKGHPEGMV